MRGALLCRAWSAPELPAGVDQDNLRRVVATAARSRIAFQYLFAERLAEGELADAGGLTRLLCELADGDHPEACANYWMLRAGAHSLGVDTNWPTPRSIPQMADLSDLTLESMALDEAFGGTLCVLAGTQFRDCVLENCVFDQCDFSDASFVSCHFRDVTFRNCDGPMFLSACSLEGTRFENGKCRTLPAVEFDSCSFDADCAVVQDQSVMLGQADYGPAVSFYEWEGAARAPDWMGGAWLGVDPHRIEGYVLQDEVQVGDPVDIIVRNLLKPFFPRRAGADAQLQARPYIRSSAVGRGRMPKDAPGASDLTDVLLSEGFTNGGREAHVYGPWSSVAGAGADAITTRNEMIEYLYKGNAGPRVRRLQDKVRKLLA